MALATPNTLIELRATSSKGSEAYGATTRALTRGSGQMNGTLGWIGSLTSLPLFVLLCRIAGPVATGAPQASRSGADAAECAPQALHARQCPAINRVAAKDPIHHLGSG